MLRMLCMAGLFHVIYVLQVSFSTNRSLLCSNRSLLCSNRSLLCSLFYVCLCSLSVPIGLFYVSFMYLCMIGLFQHQ